jgi:tRNA threonylcarbamoyladenosine biosynthesis protein TsaE
MKTFVIHTLDDLAFVAKEVLLQLEDKKVVAFNAEMGAGKTTLINAMLRAMGIQDPDGSPTYSIVNVYDSPYYGAVYHFDVYRLESIEEALEIGLEEMLYSGGYCLIEWADKITPLLPDDTVEISISVNENGERLVQLNDE